MRGYGNNSTSKIFLMYFVDSQKLVTQNISFSTLCSIFSLTEMISRVVIIRKVLLELTVCYEQCNS